MLTPNTVLIRNGATVLRDEDRVCFNKENGCVLQLNDIGYVLILHFESPSTIRQAISVMATIFGQSEDSIYDEIVGFIDYLVSLDMLATEAK